MSLKEILKNMVRDYFIITTAILMCVIVFCSIFDQEAVFTLKELKTFLLLGAVTDLPTLIYYSKKELTAKEFEIRFILQMIIIAGIVTFTLSRNGWMDSSRLIEMIVVLGEVCAVAILVRYGFWRRDKILSDKINQRLWEIRENKVVLEEDIYSNKKQQKDK